MIESFGFSVPMLRALLMTQATPSLTGDPAWPATGDVTRGLFAIFVVFGLLALLAWAGRRGFLTGLTRQAKSPITVETTVPLGERRSLVIVSVEGRRLLLGMTPMQVSLVAELGAVKASFDDTLTRSMSSASSSPS